MSAKPECPMCSGDFIGRCSSFTASRFRPGLQIPFETWVCHTCGLDWLGDTEWMVHDLRDVLAALEADPSDHRHYDGLLRVVGVDKDKRRRMAIVCSVMDGREEMVRALAEMLKGVDRSCRYSDVEDRVMAIVQGAVDTYKAKFFASARADSDRQANIASEWCLIDADVDDETEAIVGADSMARLRAATGRPAWPEEAHVLFAEGSQFIGGEDITPDDVQANVDRPTPSTLFMSMLDRLYDLFSLRDDWSTYGGPKPSGTAKVQLLRLLLASEDAFARDKTTAELSAFQDGGYYMLVEHDGRWCGATIDNDGLITIENNDEFLESYVDATDASCVFTRRLFAQ